MPFPKRKNCLLTIAATIAAAISIVPNLTVASIPTPTVDYPLITRGTDNSSFQLSHSIFARQGEVNSLAVSPDGKIIASVGYKSIHFWRFADRQFLYSGWTSEFRRVVSVAIGSNSTTVVSANQDGFISVWRMRDGKLLRTLTGHRDSVFSVAISPDGKTIVSGSAGVDKTIKIWQLADGKLLHTLTGHRLYVNSVAISPDGKTIISGSGDKTVKVWGLRDGRLQQTLTSHTASVTTVAMSPDGKNIISGSLDDTIKIWQRQE
jgi:WD40 repeat protein